MVKINMQFFGGNGASSKKAGAGGARTVNATPNKTNNDKQNEQKTLGSVEKLKEQIKNNYTQRTVQLTDNWGDPTGETNTGFVANNGTTLAAVEKVNDNKRGFVLHVGTTKQGFVATVRPGGKEMTELQAYKMLKTTLSSKK